MSSFGETLSFERPYDRKGAPRCGVYLVAPAKLQTRLFVVQLRRAFAALNASPYEKNMHALELRFPAKIYDKERQAAQELVDLARRNGVVSIIRGDVGLCVEVNADGVIVSDPAAVAQARHILGARAIIGVECGNDVGKAQAALAAEVDYVTFGKFFSTTDKGAGLDLLAWWSTTSALPAVALGNINPAKGIAMVRHGAGFLGAGSWVWNHKEGPARAIYWLQEMIEHGLSGISTN